MTSAEIYRQGYHFEEKSGRRKTKNENGMECHTYYDELVKAIVTETQQMHISALVCDLLCREETVIYIDFLAKQALKASEKQLNGGEPLKQEETKDFVPGTSIPFRQVCVEKKTVTVEREFLLKLSRIPTQEQQKQQQTEHCFYDTYAEIIEKCSADAEKLAAQQAARYLEDHIQQEQNRLQEQEEDIRRAQNDIRRAEHETFLHQISEESSHLQKNLLTEMNQVSQQLADSISRWKKDMFSMNLRSLAETYAEFYVLAHEAERETVYCMSTETDVDIRIVGILKKMKKLYRNMEQAMESLGLYISIPKAGEPLNLEEHCVSQDTTKKHRKIASCISPAILYGQDVLVQAEVVLEQKREI